MKRRVLNRDWTHLKGREIDIIIIQTFDHKIKYKGKVSEIEFDLGITIQEKNTNKYIYCLRSEFAMEKILIKSSQERFNEYRKRNSLKKAKKEYRKEFRFIVEGIEKGKIIFNRTNKIYGRNASKENCIFSQ